LKIGYWYSLVRAWIWIAIIKSTFNDAVEMKALFSRGKPAAAKPEKGDKATKVKAGPTDPMMVKTDKKIVDLGNYKLNERRPPMDRGMRSMLDDMDGPPRQNPLDPKYEHTEYTGNGAVSPANDLLSTPIA
jgi:hypothetical protein